MKIVLAIAAALGAFAAAPVAAVAQERTVVRERTVEPAARDSHVVVRERTTYRRAYRYDHRRRQDCTVRYRHGERIRTCRTRYRY